MFIKPRQSCNSQHARLEWGRSWVRVSVGTNQRLWY